MVGDDKAHLAMGQYCRLGAARRARSEEEPAGIVMLHSGVLNRRAGMGRNRLAHRTLAESALRADPPGEVGAGNRSCLIGKLAVAQKGLCAGSAREIGHFVRHQAEIGRHPHRAETKGGKHRPEHLLAILRMHEYAVVLSDAARAKSGRKRGDLGIDLAPGPGSVSPDESGPLAEPARILGQHVGEVHHPARHPQLPAKQRGRCAVAHLRPIQLPATIRAIPTTPETTPCLTCVRVTPASWPGKKPGSWSAGTRKYMEATIKRITPSAFIARWQDRARVAANVARYRTSLVRGATL